MKAPGIPCVLMVSLALFLSACGAKWKVTDAKFYKYQNHDVRVAAKLTLTEKAKPNVGHRNGVEMAMRLYSGEYGSILTEKTQTVGEGLERAGTEGVPEVISLAISEFRLGGTPNSYPDFCTELRVDDSNFGGWVRVGCVHFTDTPSESPTGGLSLVVAENEFE